MTSAQVKLKIGLDATEIKDALRRRHPAESSGSYVGQWTCIEEFANIDLLALDAWQSANVVGYEVKVSRSDLRAELLNPSKRWEAASRCTQFFIVVPHGLLMPDEIAFKEPDWSFEDFDRIPCPGIPVINEFFSSGGHETSGGRCSNPRHGSRGRRRAQRYKATDPYNGKELPKGFLARVPKPTVVKPESGMWVDGELVSSPWEIRRAIRLQGYEYIKCPACGGKGCSKLSRVEQEAPNLWIPKDVGLIEVYQSGVTSVVRNAPKNKMPKSIIALDYLESIKDPEVRNRKIRQAVADIVRWTSNRPDVRHR